MFPVGLGEGEVGALLFAAHGGYNAVESAVLASLELLIEALLASCVTVRSMRSALVAPP